MQFNKEIHDKELEELQKKVADLEAQLDYQTMRADAYDTMIDIAGIRWHINIRNKAGTKQ